MRFHYDTDEDCVYLIADDGEIIDIMSSYDWETMFGDEGAFLER